MSISSPASATASAASAASSSAIAQTGTTALGGLATNFSTFLTMLMTQLKNQDPSSPMDSGQFTSELVQFSSVEQQINTNSNLTQLITLTQASQVEQSSALLGKSATVTSSQLALQNGTASINFNTANSGPVAISVTNSQGTQIRGDTLTSAAGANTWQWDGKGLRGATEPDGPYTVTVTSVGSGATATAVPFTVTGTVTNVQNVNGIVQLQMGGLSVPFSAVQSVGGTASTSGS